MQVSLRFLKLILFSKTSLSQLIYILPVVPVLRPEVTFPSVKLLSSPSVRFPFFYFEDQSKQNYVAVLSVDVVRCSCRKLPASNFFFNNKEKGNQGINEVTSSTA
jgi:hypothetical protein